MSDLDHVLKVQKDTNILQAPSTSTSTSTKTTELSAQTDSTVSVAIVNNTSSSDVNAYVSGLALDNSSAVYLLKR